MPEDVPRRPVHSPAFRPDIDTLRAVAVLSVFFFHLGVPGFGGGYVGVDVFFVISGFLITTVITREGRAFSLADFYRRRAKRILPALFLVVAVTLLACWLVMIPPDFRNVSRSAAAVALFVSNLLFWTEAGYFEPAAHLMPLLHTWSLGVEEQFYILLPVLLLALYRLRLGKTGILAVILVLTAASLSLSVLRPSFETGDAFFLPQFRAWELLFGVLLALAAPKPPRGPAARTALALTGLALILVPVLAYSDRTPFPGLTALPPCIGTALVIFARTGPDSRTGRALSLPLPLFFGRISYALYLWHWPILALLFYRTLTPPDAPRMFAVFALTTGLAWATTRFLETPVRRSRPGFRQVLTATAAASLAVAAVGTAGYLGEFDRALPPGPDAAELATAAKTASLSGSCFLGKDQSADDWRPEACTLPAGSSDRPLILLWGDSHAAHLVPGLRRLLAESGTALVVAAWAGCPPLVGYSEADNPGCAAFNTRILAEAQRLRPATVILSARWNAFREGDGLGASVGATLAALRDTGAEVLIVGSSPSFSAPVPAIIRQLTRLGRTDLSYPARPDTANERILQQATGGGGVAFFSPWKVLCDGETCRLTDAEAPLYWDESHFTLAGSRVLAEALAPYLPSGNAGAGTGQSR